MRLLFILCFAGALSAQALASLSPMPQAATRRILGARLAKVVMIWTVELANDGPEILSISPSAILRRVPQIQPLDHAAMAMLVSDSSRNGPWARAGRVTMDVATLAAFTGAQATSPGSRLRWGTAPLLGLTAFLALAPYIVQRFQGAAIPVSANFEQIAWSEPLQVGPGEARGAYIFSAVWPNPQPIAFVIDTGALSRIRAVR